MQNLQLLERTESLSVANEFSPVSLGALLFFASIIRRHSTQWSPNFYVNVNIRLQAWFIFTGILYSILNIDEEYINKLLQLYFAATNIQNDTVFTRIKRYKIVTKVKYFLRTKMYMRKKLVNILYNLPGFTQKNNVL